MNILIFCSANNLEEKYTKPAEQFAGLLGPNGYDLVWGGSDSGLMNRIATAAQNSGSKIVGVSIPIFQDVARANADEMVVAENLFERKSIMLSRADAVVALVGGIGTLDEISEVLELKKHETHNKPIIVLNTEGFYLGFKQQLEKMKADGFIDRPLEDFIYFADQPQQAMDYINKNLAKL